MITQACRPHTFSINTLFPLQALGIRTFQSVKYIGYKFPVHQVIGTQNDSSGKKMHGGTDHIISIPNPYHIRIREICFDDRIDLFHKHLHFFYHLYPSQVFIR